MRRVRVLFVRVQTSNARARKERVEQSQRSDIDDGGVFVGGVLFRDERIRRMWVSVRANLRVAAASRRGTREPLVVALRAGGFAALLVVATTVLGVASLFAVYSWWYGLTSAGTKGTGSEGDDLSESIENVIEIPLMLVGYGFGASFVALFAQLGGDLHESRGCWCRFVWESRDEYSRGRSEEPAVVADLVGDNVGDCAARGADLFESIAAEIISAMILGATMVKRSDMSVAEAKGFVLFRWLFTLMDCFASAIGILSISDVEPRYKQEPYSVLKKGYNVALGIAIVCFGIACRCMLFTEKAEDAWKYFYACGLVGIVCGYVFVFIAQFYTDYAFSPVRKIAEASTTGSGTNVIAGVGVGLEATAAPVIVVSFAVVADLLGQNAGLVDESSDEPIGGLFGTAVATMGMLSTAAYVLTMDVFGPIADNAGGIVEMSNQPDSVRDKKSRRVRRRWKHDKSNDKRICDWFGGLGVFLTIFGIYGRSFRVYWSSIFYGGYLHSGSFYQRFTWLHVGVFILFFCDRGGWKIRARRRQRSSTTVRGESWNHDIRHETRLRTVRLYSSEIGVTRYGKTGIITAWTVNHGRHISTNWHSHRTRVTRRKMRGEFSHVCNRERDSDGVVFEHRRRSVG